MLIPDLTDPLDLFRRWFDEAIAQEPDLPNAMSLATSTPDGKPSVRMVLLKDVGDGGFVFYTNAESRKGREIGANPHGALCFHWKSLGRQVRAEGPLIQVSAAEADAYHATRPRQSQIAAWASAQSATIEGRGVLEAKVLEMEKRFHGAPVPRPPYWTGFRLQPHAIEFWHNVANRLHDRLLFERDGAGWRTRRLNP
ncbi:MAG: pyridoxamine 5'-phosphate oxidase [Rhodospirillaceae bacterium]